LSNASNAEIDGFANNLDKLKRLVKIHINLYENKNLNLKTFKNLITKLGSNPYIQDINLRLGKTKFCDNYCQKL